MCVCVGGGGGTLKVECWCPQSPTCMPTIMAEENMLVLTVCQERGGGVSEIHTPVNFVEGNRPTSCVRPFSRFRFLPG